MLFALSGESRVETGQKLVGNSCDLVMQSVEHSNDFYCGTYIKCLKIELTLNHYYCGGHEDGRLNAELLASV